MPTSHTLDPDHLCDGDRPFPELGPLVDDCIEHRLPLVDDPLLDGMVVDRTDEAKVAALGGQKPILNSR